MPLPPAPGLVCAMTIATSACTAWVIEVFSPEIRQPPSTRVAFVLRFAASDPAPGSVSARQMTASPAIPRVTHRCLTSSLPCVASRALLAFAANAR